MVELSLMASAAFSPAAVVVHHDQVLCRSPKEIQSISCGHDRLEISRHAAILMPEIKYPAHHILTDKKPLLVDFQEQCIQYEKILQYLKSRSELLDGDGLSRELLTNFQGLQRLAVSLHHCFNNAIDFEIHKHVVGSTAFFPSIHSQTQIHPPYDVIIAFDDLPSQAMRQLMFRSSDTEMKDLLSAMSLPETQAPRNSNKQSMLVPYFRRWKNKLSNSSATLPSMQAQTIELISSPETVKSKPPAKKKRSKTANRESNSLLACETLMSFLMNLRYGGEVGTVELKKSSPEISQFLTQVSAGIAGSGLAVLAAIIFKTSCSKAPFSAVKLWNTGLGFGLVWISFAVNRFRDTIIVISKNSNKRKLQPDEITHKVEDSLNKIFFRFAAILVVVVLRLA